MGGRGGSSGKGGGGGGSSSSNTNENAPDYFTAESKNKMVPGVIYDGETYQLTTSEVKRVEGITEATRQASLTAKNAELDAKKGKLGKGYGLAKRDASINSHRIGAEYQKGLGQGRLDKLNGKTYTDVRTSKEFNMGYHAGYSNNPSGYLRDALRMNPNYQHLRIKNPELVKRYA